ncbi:MAG: GtrA family protein [Alphaproteobacteria bacterium]|nr:GtrA family protein [Alphaproteobacteria bacterium]NDG03910.1 GtrA family protein [Alphaproteobacteria bacterium]
MCRASRHGHILQTRVCGAWWAMHPWLMTEAPRMARFVVVGLLNLSFGYGLYLLFLEVGWPPPVASVVSGILGIGFNFFTNGMWVFKQLPLARMHRFFVGYGATIAANALLLMLLTNLGLGPRVAQAVLIPFMVGANYAFQRWWVFQEKPQGPRPRWPTKLTHNSPKRGMPDKD